MPSRERNRRGLRTGLCLLRSAYGRARTSRHSVRRRWIVPGRELSTILRLQAGDLPDQQWRIHHRTRLPRQGRGLQRHRQLVVCRSPKCAVVTRRRDRSSSRPMRIAKALSAPWSSVNQSWTATTLSLPSSTAAIMGLSSTMARGARKTATTNSGRSQPTTGDRACQTLPTSS